MKSEQMFRVPDLAVPGFAVPGFELVNDLEHFTVHLRIHA
jgi:hypothetical protein